MEVEQASASKDLPKDSASEEKPRAKGRAKARAKAKALVKPIRRTAAAKAAAKGSARSSAGQSSSERKRWFGNFIAKKSTRTPAQQEKLSSEREKKIQKATSGAHSIKDAQVFASFPAATAEEKADFPNILASFHAWMLTSPTPKSATGYTAQAKMMMQLHDKSLTSMMSDDYMKCTKQSQENIKRNNIIGAGLTKFRAWLTERGLTGPWESRAMAGETRFKLEGGPKAEVPSGPVAGSGSITAHFAKSAVPLAEESDKQAASRSSKKRVAAKAKASGRKRRAKGKDTAEAAPEAAGAKGKDTDEAAP